MGKGMGLESHGWGATGAREKVAYGATWVAYFPRDASQMTAQATAPNVGERLRRSSAGQIGEGAENIDDDKLTNLMDATDSDEEQTADAGAASSQEPSASQQKV